MIDCHCHLDDKIFNLDLDEVVKNSKEKLKAVVSASSSFYSNQKNFGIKKQFPDFVHSCFGLDPVHCLREEKVDETIEFIRENSDVMTAIGEVGIDYYWEKNPVKQCENFTKFIKLAGELDKPIVVHARNSMEDVLHCLKNHSSEVLIHCFSGGKEHAKECMDRGYYMIFNTSSCFLPDRKSLIKFVDLDYMLTETDSPYNHPERKGRNEPVNVVYLVDLIASIKELQVDEVNKKIDLNAEKAFKIKL